MSHIFVKCLYLKFGSQAYEDLANVSLVQRELTSTASTPGAMEVTLNALLIGNLSPMGIEIIF